MQGTTEQTGQLLTAQQLAHRLNVAPLTIYRMAQRGEISFVQVGRVKRFSPEIEKALTVRADTYAQPELHEIEHEIETP